MKLRYIHGGTAEVEEKIVTFFLLNVLHNYILTTCSYSERIIAPLLSSIRL